MSDATGYGTAIAGVAQSAAVLSVGVIQGVIAKNVADKQYDIAKKQMAIAQFVQDTWKNNHLPRELKLLSEVCNEPVYKAQYNLVTTRAHNDVVIAFSKARAEQRRNLSIYAVGSFAALERQMGVAEALVTADAIAAARRREDGRVDIKRQQRIENQARVIALGRNLLDQSGAAMRAAAAGYATGGSTLASAANSGAALLGYLGGRKNGGDGGNGKTYDADYLKQYDRDTAVGGAAAYLSKSEVVPPMPVTGTSAIPINLNGLNNGSMGTQTQAGAEPVDGGGVGGDF